MTRDKHPDKPPVASLDAKSMLKYFLHSICTLTPSCFDVCNKKWRLCLLLREDSQTFYRAPAWPRYYKNTFQSSRCFAAQGSDGGGESSASTKEARQEAMGISIDAKAPDESVRFAADTAKEGLKQTTNLAKEESGDAPTEEAAIAAGGENDSEENVTVGEIGNVKGQKQSSN